MMRAEPVIERPDWATFDIWLIALSLELQQRLAELAEELKRRASARKEHVRE